MTLNALNDILWIQEDALVFAQKEVKRGKKYDMILMDPPAFGFGAKGEKWILEQKLPALLQAAYDLLSPNGTLILNTYSPKLDLTMLINSTAKVFERKHIIGKELWAKTTSGKNLFYGNLVRVKKG
jgi:23S rRNA (cytosine1962-C5)-methyltransferase